MLGGDHSSTIKTLHRIRRLSLDNNLDKEKRKAEQRILNAAMHMEDIYNHIIEVDAEDYFGNEIQMEAAAIDIADVFEDLHDYDKAIFWLEILEGSDPFTRDESDEIIKEAIARCCFKAGHYEKAINYQKKCCEILMEKYGEKSKELVEAKRILDNYLNAASV